MSEFPSCEELVENCRSQNVCAAYLTDLEQNCPLRQCLSDLSLAHRCSEKQKTILDSINQQLREQGVRHKRFFDCGCKNPTDSSNSPSTHDQCPQTIQDTINHLHFDYEDCHPQYWDNWSAECQGHYRSCINQNNAIDCGIPLLNISISCHVENDTCTRDDCIAAVGQFFFTNGNFEFTKNLFKCCEHEHKCNGFPNHIYSPWSCIKSDPFYSCSQVYEECMSSEYMGCKDQYEKTVEACPNEIFEGNEDCKLDEITPECITNIEKLEGWYCSCRHWYESDESGNNTLVQMSVEEKKKCLKYRRIFTHNKCIEKAKTRSTVPQKDGKDSFVPFILLGLLGVTLGAIGFYCIMKLRKNSRQFNHRNLLRYVRPGSQQTSQLSLNQALITERQSEPSLILNRQVLPNGDKEISQDTQGTEISGLY